MKRTAWGWCYLLPATMHRVFKCRRSVLAFGIAASILIGWPLFTYWMDIFEPPVMVFDLDHDLLYLGRQPLKRILYWNPFFDEQDYYFGFGTKPFLDYGCNVTCETTNDRNQYNTSHAILFHVQTLRLSDMPKYRFPHQRWIFFMMESPDNTIPYNKLHYLNNTFNWTMTYRLDSDILLTYGLFTKRPTSLPQNGVGVDNFSKRTKSVMWVVSECRTYSRREWYAKELAKYIDVDIYGSCGRSCCCTDDNRDACNTVHLSTYKFYLAFENSLCKDYNTEKFYRGARYQGPIPIVYGNSDYSSIAPPKYFIDIKDFESPKKLAHFLKVLGSDANMYNSYYDWRVNYSVTSDGIFPAFCNLCQKLNLPSEMPSEYPNIYDWWVVKGNCILGDFKF